MADEKSSGSWGSGFVALAFAAVSAAYLTWKPPPLVSSRPAETQYEVHDLKGMPQDIDARLWQDPFDAVMREIDETRLRDPQTGSLGSDPRPQNTLVLGVTLPGAPYPEIAETRRRLRYAVLSALHVAGYTPADEKHLGYWRLSTGKSEATTPEIEATMSDDVRVLLSNGGREKSHDVKFDLKVPAAKDTSKTADQPPLPGIVPWEEFDKFDKRLNDNFNRILVLWLDEDVLTAGHRPIASLRALRRQTGFPKNSEFALLGPENSTTLKAMVREDSCKQPSEQPCDTSLSVYNFGATAEPDKITRDGDIEKELSHRGIQHYYATVNTDDKLAQAIASELLRRDRNLPVTDKVCPAAEAPGKTACNHVVLVSDWDTEYGKNLLDSVAKAFGVPDSADLAGSKWVRKVSYLRGLDGRLPGRKYGTPAKSAGSGDTEQDPAAQTAAGSPKAATPENARSDFESAEGQSQFDYLHRLAVDLRERDAKYRRKEGSRIAAIGVLGSDVYDKLLILQALRPVFPDALFFTTDLDELLLPQKKTRYTRNLLVASSFGLTLGDGLQADIPPFRDTYQTSVFLATRLAIHNEMPASPPKGAPAPNKSDGQTDSPTADAAGKTAVQLASAGTAAPETPEHGPKGSDLAACKTREALERWLAEPQLFQIGRTEPFALPMQKTEATRTDSKCKGPASNQAADPKSKPLGEKKSKSSGDILDLLSIQPDPASFDFPRPRLSSSISATVLVSLTLICVCWCWAWLIRQWRSLSRSDAPAPLEREASQPSMSADPKASFSDRLVRRAAFPLGLAIISAYVCFAWPVIAQNLTSHGLGEPMSLFEGISLWPVITLRLVGLNVCLWLIGYTFYSIDATRSKTYKEMAFEEKPDPPAEPSPLEACFIRSRARLRGMVDWLKRQYGCARAVGAQVQPDVPSTVRLFVWVKQRLWYTPAPTPEGTGYDEYERPEIWFKKLSGQPAGEAMPRLIRAAVATGAVFAFGLIFTPLLGTMNIPSRGILASWIFFCVTFLEVIATLVLTYSVVDLTMYSRSFIKDVIRVHTIWPRTTITRFGSRIGVDGADLDDWLDLRYLAARTRSITDLIYFPFIGLAFLIVSLNNLLDDFTPPLTIMVVWAISVFATIGSAVLLRAAAEEARTAAIQHLNDKIIACKGPGCGQRVAEQLSMLLAEIENLNEGAFAPWAGQPVVRAVLLPLLTYGGTMLVHLYALPGS